MLKNHAPMKRSDITHRALGQMRPMKMPELTDLLVNLENEGLIDQYKVTVNGKGGRQPDWFALTLAGKLWIREEIKLNKKKAKGVR